MDDFRGISVAEVAAAVRGGDTSAREQTDRALAAIDATNDRLGAFVAVDGDAARAEADAIDARLAAGEDVGPLAGVPIGVKDLEDAIGYVTTRGSALHRDDPPATEDSLVVARLRAAGCVVVGKTNTPEFGWQGDTTNEIFPASRNPWNPDRSPGGSSGGTGAAIAAGMVPLATGSDGGGSIRIPSALCGLSGLKPSLGRVPLGGTTASPWLHYSTPGPMARRIDDVTLALDAVVGPHPLEPHALPMPKGEQWAPAMEPRLLPRAVLWSENLGYGTTDREIAGVCRRAVDALSDAGVEIIEVDVWPEDPVRPWATLAFGGLQRVFAEHRDTPVWDTITPGLRAMLDLFADIAAADVYASFDAGYAHNARLVELFHQAPLLLAPTVAGQTARSGDQGTIDGDETPSWVSYTYGFNMTGNPAGSVCAGFTDDGMPVGLQVIGPQHADVAVLRAISALEDLLGVDTVAPMAWADGEAGA